MSMFVCELLIVYLFTELSVVCLSMYMIWTYVYTYTHTGDSIQERLFCRCPNSSYQQNPTESCLSPQSWAAVFSAPYSPCEFLADPFMSHGRHYLYTAETMRILYEPQRMLSATTMHTPITYTHIISFPEKTHLHSPSRQ